MSNDVIMDAEVLPFRTPDTPATDPSVLPFGFSETSPADSADPTQSMSPQPDPGAEASNVQETISDDGGAPSSDAPAVEPAETETPRPLGEILREERKTGKRVSEAIQKFTTEFDKIEPLLTAPSSNAAKRLHYVVKMVKLLVQAQKMEAAGLTDLETEEIDTHVQLMGQYAYHVREVAKAITDEVQKHLTATVTEIQAALNQLGQAMAGLQIRNGNIVDAVNAHSANIFDLDKVDKDQNYAMRALLYMLCERGVFKHPGQVAINQPAEDAFDANLQAYQEGITRIYRERIGFERELGPQGERVLAGGLREKLYNPPVGLLAAFEAARAAKEAR